MEPMEIVGKRVLPVFGVIVILAVVWYVGVRVLDWSSVSASSDAVLPVAIACNINTNLSGDTQSVSLTRRPTILEDWVKARSALVSDARTEAEGAAKDSFEDYYDDIDCPEACPDNSLVGALSYNTTNTRITGSEGLGYIRYDVTASSQASGVIVCK